MLTLESFKLLNPKVAQFERGTGGTPEITFQEVADVLSRCTTPCSMYGRYQYGLDWTYESRLVDLITDEMMRQDRKRKRPLLSRRQHWRSVTRMTLEAHRAAVGLTKRQKKFVADVRRWTRHHEQAHQKVRETLDNWDYELRNHLGAWNRDQREHGNR